MLVVPSYANENRNTATSFPFSSNSHGESYRTETLPWLPPDVPAPHTRWSNVNSPVDVALTSTSALSMPTASRNSPTSWVISPVPKLVTWMQG